jgi:hypothetical protein
LPPNTINNGENNPFKAVRPTRDKVSFVSCRSYEEYVTALAAQLVLIPCFFACFKTCLYESRICIFERYRQVNQKYQDFKAEKILVKDKAAAIYIHKIITTAFFYRNYCRD